jgi:DNA polymerase-1
LEQVKPDYVVAAVDSDKPTFRVEDFTQYKAHRGPMEEALNSQIPKVMEILDAFGIKRIVADGYEADDIIGTLATRFASTDLNVLIVSNDKDLWQLVNDNVLIMIPNTKGEIEWLGVKEVVARMSFEPKFMVDYKGLRGDPSDNIPGVFGVGEKTAKSLIAKFGTVENVYHHIDEVTPDSLRSKLINCAETALTSKKLAKIIVDMPLSITLGECKYLDFNKSRVVEVLKRYNFKSLIRRLGFEVDTTQSKSKNVVPDNQPSLL